MAAKNLVRVHISITTLRAELARRMEPRAASRSSRQIPLSSRRMRRTSWRGPCCRRCCALQSRPPPWRRLDDHTVATASAPGPAAPGGGMAGERLVIFALCTDSQCRHAREVAVTQASTDAPTGLAHRKQLTCARCHKKFYLRGAMCGWCRLPFGKGCVCKPSEHQRDGVVPLLQADGEAAGGGQPARQPGGAH